jgi:hypothetical protein
MAFAALVGARAQDRATFDIPESTFDAIVGCLSQGREIVMAPKLDCVPRQDGAGSGDKIAKQAHIPLGERDWDGDWN